MKFAGSSCGFRDDEVRSIRKCFPQNYVRIDSGRIAAELPQLFNAILELPRRQSYF
jgi:hypothetical protein